METKVISTIKGHARVDVADVLRGLAVMGIIILHSIEHFNFYSFPDTTTQSDWLNFTDKATEWIILHVRRKGICRICPSLRL